MARRTIEDIAYSYAFGPGALSRASIERCIEAWQASIDSAKKYGYQASRSIRQNIKAGHLALKLLNEKQGESTLSGDGK